MHNDTTNKRAAELGTKSGGHKPGWFGLRFGHDAASRELRVCMTRAVAGVSVAGFCGLLIGVVAVSRNASNNGPQSAHAAVVAPATDDSQSKVAAPRPAPARPRTLLAHTAKPLIAANVPPRTTATPAAALPKARPGATATASTTPPTSPESFNKDSSAPATVNAAPVVAAPKAPEGRMAGHNYLVFGSFPTQAEAKRVVQKLHNDGVSCTIERSLPGWTKKGWYSVVGVKGYPTTKNAAYQSDLKSLENLGVEPRAYRWRNTGA
jgi:hypothetical protein